MSRIIIYTFALCSFFGIVLPSCTKPDGTPPNNVLADPTVVLTPAKASGTAGDLVAIDYVSTAPKGIKHIRIDELYNGHTRVLTDSECVRKPKFNDENFQYFIPDSAITGQVSVLTFTISDSTGKSAVKQATITVTHSRPRITVTQNKTTAHVSDSVMFTITVKSSENNLDSLVISAMPNTTVLKTIAIYTYANVSSISKTFWYRIPVTATAGDHIYLFFRARNNAGISTSVNKSVDIN